MSSSEVHELAVAIKPEGIDETTGGLDRVSEKFDETADSVGDTAGLLGGLSQRIKGSAAAIIGGLAVLSAGLLNQVPVIGEAMSGLGAVFDALALRIDSVLRPVLGPLTTAFFALADGILQAEGPLGAFIDIVATAAVIAPFVAALGLLITNFGAIAGVVGAVVAVLAGPLTLAILAISAVIAAVLVAWKNNWFGIRDITQSVIETVVSAFNEFVSFLSDIWSDPIGAVFDFVEVMVTSLGRLINAYIALVQKLSARIHTGFEVMFDLVLNAAKSWANSFVSIIETAVNTAIRAIPDEVTSRLGLSTVSLGQPFNVRDTSDIIQSGADRLRSRDRRISANESERNRELEQQVSQIIDTLEGATRETVLNVDGRELARTQDRFLGNGAANVGRVNRSR